MTTLSLSSTIITYHRDTSQLRDKRNLYSISKNISSTRSTKKGLGKALIQHGIDFISSFKIKHCKIELNVNRNNGAVGFYEKMGFKIDRSGDFDIGNGYYMNDYIMIKELHL
jgi:Acetyltransferase (GNAT) family.